MEQPSVRELAGLLGKEGIVVGEASDYIVEHLDYEYVNGCTDLKELALLLKVLRSGKEGHWPHLEQHIEARMGVLDPSLVKQDPVVGKQSHKEALDLLSDWSKDLKSAEKSTKRVNIKEKSSGEVQFLAENEKNKGNEAFRAKDWEEALSYYTRSLDLVSSATVYSNRSLTNLKLKRFKAALSDASEGLLFDGIEDKLKFKLFSRRGQARMALKMFSQAMEDFNECLLIDPESQEIKQLRDELEKKQERKGMKKMVIEEVCEPEIAPAAEPMEQVTVGDQLVVEEED